MLRNTRFTRRHLAASTAGVLLVVGGTGAAVAATSGSSPAEESQAVIAAAADDLGITSAKLTAALKSAMVERIDEAVAAGTLTEARATELKQRIAAGDVPLVGIGGGAGHHGGRGDGDRFRFGGMEAAASYLGVTEEALRTARGEDKSLATLAQEQGKTVDGLVDAMVAAATTELATAVQAGDLTDADRDAIVATLEDRITEHVNRAGHPPRP